MSEDREDYKTETANGQSKLGDGLNDIANLIESARDDICRAQRRLVQKGEGVARSEAASVKATLTMALMRLNGVGI